MNAAIIAALEIAPKTLTSLIDSLANDFDLDADSFDVVCDLGALRDAGLVERCQVARGVAEYALV